MKRSLHILPGWLLLCILLVSGCIYEDVEHCEDFETCEVAFSFRYDYNMYYADRFAEEVDHISLFIYDAATQELKLRIDKFRTGMEPGQTITTELPAGEYIAVTWGNCDQQTDYFAITQPDRLSTLQMGLTCIGSDNEATVNRIGSVFHALYAFEVTGGGTRYGTDVNDQEYQPGTGDHPGAGPDDQRGGRGDHEDSCIQCQLAIQLRE